MFEANMPSPDAAEILDPERLAAEFDDVERARAGDRRAFARLYRAYGAMVHGVVLSRAQGDDVADVVQEVFMTALSRLPELHDVAAFGGWLAAIARNKALDHRRRERTTLAFVETDVASTDASVVHLAEARAVLRKIRALPEAYRETLVLRLVEGMSGPEIALRTGLTAGSVRVNLHRGMKLLRERLGAKEDV